MEGNPIHGKILPGDLLSHLNGASLQGLEINSVIHSIFRENNANQRELVVLRKSNNSNNNDNSNSNSNNNKASPKKKRPSEQALVATGQRTSAQNNKNKKPKIDHAYSHLHDLDPGFVSRDGNFYCTQNNETMAGVAEKLGTDCKAMANLQENIRRYGLLKGNSLFRPFTLLRIPAEPRSKWRIQQMMMPEEDEDLEKCVECGISSNPAKLLLCDGCDAHHHVKCVGLDAVPEGDWFCHACLEVLEARKEHGDVERKTFKLPPVPPLNSVMSQEEMDQVYSLRLRLRDYLKRRRRQDLQAVKDNCVASKEASRQLVQDLERELNRIESEISRTKELKQEAHQNALRALGIQYPNSIVAHPHTITLRTGHTTFLTLREREERVLNRIYDIHRPPLFSNRWNAALARVRSAGRQPSVLVSVERMKSLEKNREQTKKNLKEAQEELRDADGVKLAEEQRLQVFYASMLEEPKLPFETMGSYNTREFAPRYLGQIALKNDADVCAIYMLREPDELIFIVPFGSGKAKDDSSGDKESEEGGQDPFQPQPGHTYGVFARRLLFSKERDDEMPMETNGVRDAQRKLFQLLSASPNNQRSSDAVKENPLILTRPCCPPTVLPRDHTDANHTKYFDLGKLVQDCNADLDLPREPTPNCMKEQGLSLHDYQESTLRWLLDKEKFPSPLGLAGEFWHRLRYLDANVPADQNEYFYCDLTGSFALNIFDFKGGIQRDASLNRFAMPMGAVNALEMGLGKTAVTIALILKNPPPLHRRILPREHTFLREKQSAPVDHPLYTPPPQFGHNNSTTKSNKLSNGTLIIVPMTLLSQWQTEIERFAPQLSVLALHSAENPTIQDVAAKDVILASTFIFQDTRGSHLRMIKKIHWHRIVVDEAHTQREDHQLTRIVGTLFATHRIALTGTPLGGKLSDFQGQIRYLRIEPFSRPDFWKNNIDDPYKKGNLESLRVLRSLLSRIVCRYSKDQMHSDGTTPLLSLPPRTVETVVLTFGSKEEEDFYKHLDSNNRTIFRKLKHNSAATVAESYMALSGLLLAARQACCHVSLVSLAKIDRYNRIKDQRKKDLGITEIPRDLQFRPGEEKTRAGLLKLAMHRARATAKNRMMTVLSQYQVSGVLLECPVCFDCTEESELAIPACAHPLCSECMLNLLSSASSTREATGHCPTCRDVIRRQEVTFLGDAEDAGTHTGEDSTAKECDKKRSPTKFSTALPSFNMETAEVHAAAVGATTARVGTAYMNEQDLARKIREEAAALSTLDESFVSNHTRAERMVGTKMSQLLQEIDAMMKKDAKSKCVVFSQFQDVLDIAKEELLGRGIHFVRIYGNCKQHERADALLEFSSNPDVRVFLLSMRVGSTGLTLTSADHCFILDIAQNTAIEEQAIDRIHRIGQCRPVLVKRFVIEDTVEERLLNIRRALLADRPSGSSGISETSLLDNEEATYLRKHKVNKKERDEAADKQRLDMLENLLGQGDVNKA